MARYEISHRTDYTYAMPVSVSHHATRLKPRNTPRQQCRHYQLHVRPEPMDLSERRDYFGNLVQHFSVQEMHRSLVVECVSEVSVEPVELPFADLTPSCAEVLELLEKRPADEALTAIEYRYASPSIEWDEPLAAFAEPFFPPDAKLLDCACALTASIYEQFTFDATATDVTTPVMEAFELGRGVCQDFAHLMIAALRSQGFAARYVSGYLLTESPPGAPRLIGADASHAWVAVWLPPYGWIELDPTNCQLCSEEHITVAYGRDFSDVAPIKGAVTGGGEHVIGIAVTVSPVEPPYSPRLRLPHKKKPAEPEPGTPEEASEPDAGPHLPTSEAAVATLESIEPRADEASPRPKSLADANGDAPPKTTPTVEGEQL
ncbi:MAG: transglutaminase N-terminal domain-containing protein [Opitutales bacterium]